MEKKEDFLNPDEIGEMYVTWRLEEGLFSSEDGERSISLLNSDSRRTLALNDFAREVGAIMMPYLSSHPDVGFESFRSNLWEMAKIGNVTHHSATLDGEYPHRQIFEKVSLTYVDLENRPGTVMNAYIILGKNQKIQMYQYARLKFQICMRYGIKHLDMNIIYDELTNPYDTGSIQIWMA